MSSSSTKLFATFKLTVSLIAFSASFYAKGQNGGWNEKVGLSHFGYNSFDKQHDTTLARDIDSILFNCPERREATTIGDITCYQQSIDAAERLISREYNLLLRKLDSTDKQLLKNSQLNWKKFFQSERKFLNNSFYTRGKYGGGREAAIDQLEWIFKLARQRLIALRVYNSAIFLPYGSSRD